MSGSVGNENIHVRITCPHCRKQFHKTVAWINSHDYVRCDFCREPSGLNAYKRPDRNSAVGSTRHKPKR